jgi:hypothetical protein
MLIYATCDRRYQGLYENAFTASARAFGHDVEVFCDDDFVHTEADAMRIVLRRFQILPDLLRKHGSALMLDVDSMVRRPITIEPEYDLGIFLRPTPEKQFRTLCSVFYCTDRAMAFAEAMKAACDKADPEKLSWCDEQGILWDVYDRLGDQYHVKFLDRSFIDWEWPCKAAVYTGKGAIKATLPFKRELEKWRRRSADMERAAC